MWMRLPLHWLRTLLWALCLALPLQVATAASLLACAMPAGQSAPSQPSPPEHQAHAMTHEVQHHSTAHAHHAPSAHAQDGDSGHDDAGPGAHKCSACAACCTGAALPCRVEPLPLASGHPVQSANEAWFRLSASIAPLERPPRARAA